MARALYRTHRSRSLDEVVGQEHITELLKRSLQSGRISHAYLLTGPRGVGKTSVARILAHEINGLPYSDDPNLDIIEMDAASNRRIDDVRELRDNVRLAPIATKYKVYIIDEVHMLTTESFNALLKTLEEPPEHAVFILATTDVHKVPMTILSRTQRFHFRPASIKKVADHLQNISTKEKISATEEALQLIARHGGGSFRDSISLLDQLSASGESVTRELVEQTLGLVPTDQITRLIEFLLSHQSGSVIDVLQELNDAGVSAVVAVDQLIHELSSHADRQPGLYQLIDRLLEVHRAQHPFIKLTATLVGYCEQAHPKVIATSATMPRAIVSDKPKQETTKTPATVPAAKLQPSVEVAEVIIEPKANNSDGVFDWQKVLATLKSHHPALHSVLSRATIDCDDKILTLTFVFALHRKKVEQPQYKAQLIQVIQDTCGLNLEINITQANPTLTEEATQVATLMGGGEPVHAN